MEPRVCGATLLLALAWCGPTLSAESPPDPRAALAAEVGSLGWIAYGARSPDGDYDLFVCRPDGSNVRALTHTPEFSEFSPQFSRDGKKLLYRRVPRSEKLDNNRHGEQGELVLSEADGTGPRVLGRPGELPWASFSPDGSQIASLSIKGVSFYSLERREVLRAFPRKGFFQQMTWSPDGKWLCGVANSFGASWSIARMDVATGEATAVNRVDCCTPDWFPDSGDIIFSWRPPGQKANKGYGWTELWRAKADGSSRQLVYAEEGRHVYGGNISPDGKYVVFTGNMEEDGDPGQAGAPMGLMRLIDAPCIAGESKEVRARHPEAKTAPVLSLPAGWEPCWTSAEVVSLATSDPGHDSTANGAALRSELGGQGSLLFSARTEARDWDLFCMHPDGTGRRNLTSTPGYNEAGARVSPDGTRLFYYRMPVAEPVDNNNYGTFDLVIANSNGTEPVVLGKDFQWASWSPDGRRLACLGQKAIRIIDLATRAAVRELPRRGIVSQLTWSPDGAHFTGTANGLGQFWNIGCLDAETGEIHAVSETDRYNCTSDWTPDSRRIVYARGIIPQQPGRAQLWSVAVDGSHRERLYAEEGRHIYGACASPDGQHLVFTRSVEDLGKVADIQLAIIRWPAPGAAAQAGLEPRLDLGPGWEPCWTSKEIPE